jgi:hypothetical protein
MGFPHAQNWFLHSVVLYAVYGYHSHDSNLDTHECDYDTHDCELCARVEFYHDACNFNMNQLKLT